MPVLAVQMTSRDERYKVFKLMLRMQTWMQVLIAACVLSMVSSVPTLSMRAERPSKYKAQMFDCGEHGKIQVLQIPEKCSEDSNEEGEPMY